MTTTAQREKKKSTKKEPKKNPAAVALGKMRVAKLTRRELVESCRKAGIASAKARKKKAREES